MFLIFKSLIFGLSLALALIIGNFLLWKKAKAKDLESETIFDLSLLSLTGGLVLGRIFYILSHWELFQIDVFRWIHLVRYPGFSGKGVMIGFLLTLWYLSAKKKVNFWLFADCLVAPFLYALFLLQAGCLVNSCVVGTVTNLPWSKTYLGFLGNRHPLGLYAIAGTVLLMFLVKRWEALWPKFVTLVHQKNSLEAKQAGWLFLFSVSVFFLLNFVLDIFKQNALYWGKVNLEIIIDLVFVLAGLLLLFLRFGKKLRQPV